MLYNFFCFQVYFFTPLSASLIWGAFINTLKFICILHIISHSDQDKKDFSCVFTSETETSDFNKRGWMDKISPYFSAFKFNSILTYYLCCAVIIAAHVVSPVLAVLQIPSLCQIWYCVKYRQWYNHWWYLRVFMNSFPTSKRCKSSLSHPKLCALE